MSDHHLKLDYLRAERVGLDEAVLCAGKTSDQIEEILSAADAGNGRLLLTRLDVAKEARLADRWRRELDFDPVSRTAILGEMPAVQSLPRVAVVSAGTSDAGPSRESVRTLRYYGEPSLEVHDVGVAGLWRLLERIEELREVPVLIVVAGMDGALPSVVGGLVPGAVIAVPSSTGYGVAEAGRTALHAALTSCSSGIVVVNIDNGYGAACAAMRMLRSS